MNKGIAFTIVLVFVISLTWSCKKDKTNEPYPPFNASTGMYISCEGVFRSANASVSYYNPADHSYSDDVFHGANNRTLGDVCQSMSLINGKVYLVVNNSGRIEVCNLNTMKSIATINSLTSPRYIVQVDPLKAYVSDYSANHLSVIDLADNTISSTIPLPGWTEQMQVVNNNVYVTDYSSDYLYLVDHHTDLVADSILISKGAGSLRLDKNGKLWVLCGGDYSGLFNGALYRIDTATKSVEQSFTFNSLENPNHLCLNSTADTLYFINSNVYKMSIASATLPATPFIASNNNTFYSLAVDPSTNDVYVSDAIDYIQRGRVYRYSLGGVLRYTIIPGILPGDFLFF